MAYTYTPFSPSPRATAPEYDSYEGGYRINNEYVPNLDKWNQQQTNIGIGAFNEYAQNQFKGLFDIANAQSNAQSNLKQGFAQTPMYSPYSGTRSDFTSGGERLRDEGSWETRPTVFDQQGYLDARFGNINNYLSQLGSFLGNMSGDPSAGVRQGEAQRAMYLASLPQMQTMQPMQQSTHTGGGWGQQSPVASSTPMTYRQQAPAGILGTTNRGLYGGILGGQQGV